jgi:cell division protein FtsN
MEEKNELNDIILSKSGSNSNSKKLLLAIAALTLILIIVLVIMNSLKAQSSQQPPASTVPPAPSSPTEIIDDPLFEPVEVIQEGAGNVSATEGQQDLGQIAQKIKQESMQNAPASENVVQNTPAPVVGQSIPTQQAKQIPVPVAAVPAKITPKPIAQNTSKVEKVVVNTPTIKTTKPSEAKKVTEPKKVVTVTAKAVTEPLQKGAETTAKPAIEATVTKVESMGTYYIQVGSFSKEPSKLLFDRLNASGLKYTTVPNGTATKVMVGPFQGEKSARDVLGTVKRNVEAGAYITKG